MSAAGEARRSIRVGVDIGGTFTDAVVVDGSGGVAAYKVPTTPDRLAAGFMAVVDEALEDQDARPDAVRAVAHATTVATNAIIEGMGAPVALVVTEGFRDILEIARQVRPDLFDLLRQKPAPLVPRDRVFEIAERIGPEGRILRPLDGAALDDVVDRVRDCGVRAVVVCLLHSYVNPAHEREVADRLRTALTGVDVSASAEVWPEFREYFRACTAVVNAMIRPILRSYLGAVRGELVARGIDAPLWVMQSGGGVLSEQAAADLPVQVIESGPAAGLTYVGHLGRTLGQHDLVSFEVGGTTAKAGLVSGGVPATTAEFEIGAMASPGGGRGRGSGYPIKTPVLDLVEIGAGGGSLAWIDSGGVLRVGPRSAGADPGPACYLRGGERPTLTDANLVLGRIDPERFLGGGMPLCVEAAVRSIERHCADLLGLGVAEVARGIVDVATASMARALRLVTVERGHDPVDFALVAFGGAGPLHAAAVAAEVGLPRVLVPLHPGVLSAAGLLVAPVQVVEVRTALTDLASLDPRSIERGFEAPTERARRAVVAQGVTPADVEVVRALDLRYRGQSYELTVPVDDAVAASVEALAERFHEAHERAYGHAAPGEPIEVVNWRVTGREREQRQLALPRLGRRHGSGPAPVARRPPPTGGPEVLVYERADLLAGDELEGPAVVAEPHSTTYVPAGHVLRVDDHGTLWIADERPGTNGRGGQS